MSKVTAATILKKAVSYLGTKEIPANSNNVIFNTHYYGRKVNGSAYPWCCAFVWDIFRMCGASELFAGGKKTAYCPEAENWYKKQGKYYKEGKQGDLCFMDFGKGRASHIGIVEKKTVTGAYKVIEGNTSVTSNDNGGKVMRRTRRKNVIRGFGRPAYTISTTSTIKAGSKVKIKAGAIYGGASYGKKVGSAYIGKKYTVSKVQTNNNQKEALIKELNSWVPVKDLIVV